MSAFGGTWEGYGPGQKAPVGALEHRAIRERMLAYKKQVAKRYRVVFPENLGRFLPESDLFISSKIDGELWFLAKRDGEVVLCATNGRMLKGVPVVDEAAAALESVGSALFAGELCAAPPDGSSRPRVGHVALCLGDARHAGRLAFRVFDALDVDGADVLNEPYEARYERMSALFGGGRRCNVVTTVRGGRDVARDCFDDWVGGGKHEGLVVRSPQGITYKVKPFLTLDAVVLAFGERDTHGRPEVRELTVGLMRDDGTWHILGSVGSGFGESDRGAWHARLSALEVPSSFRMANREGTLCRFVRPEIVIEVKVSDLVDTDSRDLPVRRMALRHDPEAGWSAVGTIPFVSMIHPTMVRERADKPVDTGNVGLDQVFQYVPMERDVQVEPANLTDASVLRREVYAKVTKGKTAVRKVVVLATGKEDDPEYPPFVVYFTDFSAGRKDPLKVDLRPSEDRARADAIADAWLEENVKKGWERVGGAT